MFALFGGAGLYAAEGIHGSQKGKAGAGALPDGTIIYTPIHNTIKFNNNTNNHKQGVIYINPFDAGYNFLGGAEWRNIILSATYSHGRTKLFDADQYKNGVFSVNLAYMVSLKNK